MNGNIWECMKVYRMVREAYGIGIKGVCMYVYM